MREYSVAVSSKAKKTVKKLSAKDKKTIVSTLEGLAFDPRPKGVEKLQLNPNFWRLRCGNHRIIYSIDDDTAVVAICLVRRRGEAYQNLGDLDKILAAIDMEKLSDHVVARGAKH